MPPDATFIVGDAGDQSRVGALIAAHRIGRHYPLRPLDRRATNTVNSRALIEVAVKTGVRYFIFSSTAAFYGNPQRVPLREDDPTVPTSPYGSSTA